MKQLLLIMLLLNVTLGSQGPGAIQFVGGKPIQIRFPELLENDRWHVNDFKLSFSLKLDVNGKVDRTQLIIAGVGVDFEKIPEDFPLWKKSIVLSVIKSHSSFIFSPIKDLEGNQLTGIWFNLEYRFRQNNDLNRQISISKSIFLIATDNPTFSDTK